MTRITCRQNETLTDALSSADGPTTVFVGSGETRFTEPVTYDDDHLHIEGQGKEYTTLRADGVARFFRTFDDNPDTKLTLSNLTLDMDHVPGDGRVFQLAGDRGPIVFDNVRFQNINLEEQTGNTGLVWTNRNVEHLAVRGQSEVRFDSLQNRQPNKYAVYYQSGSAVTGTLHVGPEAAHHGELWDEPGDTHSSRETEYYVNGYVANIHKVGRIHGAFYDWDQYAGWLTAAKEGARIVYDGTVRMAGLGDTWRTSANGEGVGSIEVGGSVDTAPGYGDRSYIHQGGAPANIHFDGFTSKRATTAVELRGGRNITGNFTAVDAGSTGGSGNPALQINDKGGSIGSFDLDVTIRSESDDRVLEPAVELLERNGDWDDGQNAISGIAREYEETQVARKTDCCVFTKLLFDYPPDDADGYGN